MKKYYSLVLLLIFSAASYSQDTNFQFHSIANINFKRPVLLGRVNENYIVMDLPDASGTPLYVIGPSFKIITQRYVSPSVYSGSYSSDGKKINILWKQKQDDTISLHLLRLDENGNPETRNSQVVHTEKGAFYGKLLNDKNNRYHLFFSSYIDTLQHIFIKGALFDSSLNKVKDIFQALDFDATLERFSKPVLDVSGNLHILISDKLDNYRESGNVRINTIPLKENAVLEESFQFSKIKFYDFLLFDNIAAQQVQLAGFYYDGINKKKKGIATLGFPYTRHNTVSQKFTLLSTQQRIYLATGLKNINKRNDILDYLKVKDMTEVDGHIFISAWMLDVPGNLIVKDEEQGDRDNMAVANWIQPGIQVSTDNLTGPKSNIPTPVDAVNPPPAIYKFAEDYNDPRQPGMRVNNTAKTTNRRDNNLLSEKKVRNNNAAKIPLVKPGKIVFFSLDQSGAQQWMQLAPGDFPVKSVSYGDSLQGYPLYENERLYLPGYLAVNENQTGNAFSVISVNELGVTQKNLPVEVPGNYRFSKPVKIPDGRYAALYQNINTQESGLVVLDLAVR